MASSLKIATATATGKIAIGKNDKIDLKKLFENIPIAPSNKNEGILSAVFNKEVRGIVKKRVKKRNKGNKEPKCTRKFENQVSLFIRRKFDEDEIDEKESAYIDRDKCITSFNVKVFPNGMVQMTGLKSLNQGYWVLYFLSIFLNIKEEPFDYQIHMINSHFKFGYALDFDLLMDRIADKGLFYVYDPVTYHGLKVSFWYNNHMDGICHCNPKCKSKTRTKATQEGRSKAESKCKKITIIFFHTGAIIITGANKIEHIETCYKQALSICKEE
jgi:hypothetical protein